MNTLHWYYAHLRWAVMVEGKEGLRHWMESVYIFRSESRETAFRQALEMGYQREGLSKDGRRLVRHQFAAVLTLDALGQDPWRFQVDLEVKKPEVHLPFEHVFDPAGTEPAPFF
jgi:hypothetical protein